MNDNLFRRSTRWLAQGEGSTEARALVRDLADALRASDRDIATARAELATQNADTDALLDKLMDGEGELREFMRGLIDRPLGSWSERDEAIRRAWGLRP